MENGEFAAFPFLETDNHNMEYGLTKREYFAAMAMQGLLACPNDRNNSNKEWGTSHFLTAKNAVSIADELLKQLEK